MIIKSKFYDIVRAYEKEYSNLRIAFWWNESNFVILISQYSKHDKGANIYERMCKCIVPIIFMNETLFTLTIGDLITTGIKKGYINAQKA